MRKSGWKTRQEVKDSDESMSSVVRQRATEWAIAQADFQRKEDERTKKDAAKSKKLVGGKTSKEQAKKGLCGFGFFQLCLCACESLPEAWLSCADPTGSGDILAEHVSKLTITR